MKRTLVLVLAISFQYFAIATTWTVGVGQTYTAPSQVAALVADGDTVNIMAGGYPGDVTNWTANNLVLQGINGHAVISANGQAWGGKAIWVIEGDNTTVEYVAFTDCSVVDMNGAGIRQEGHHLTVRHCVFGSNENGILAGDQSPSNISIEYSEFYNNGYGDGLSHNLYINHIDTLFFRYNYTHRAHIGHELKSRAQVNFIEYNRIGNEFDGDASREIDLPNGGQSFVIGNSIQQGAMSTNGNMIEFGQEGLSNNPPHHLYFINNTVVDERNNGSIFDLAAGVDLFKCYSNIFVQFSGSWMIGAQPVQLDSVGNVFASYPADVSFAAPAFYDYRIPAGSLATSSGFPAGYSASGYALVAWDEYVHPTNSTVRCQHATLDAGAFESCTVGLDDMGSNEDVSVWPNPASNVLHVELPSGDQFAGLSVTNLQGKLVGISYQNHLGRLSINTAQLAAGVHTLRIHTATTTRTVPFLVIH